MLESNGARLTRLHAFSALILTSAVCIGVARKGAYSPPMALGVFGGVALAALLALRRLFGATSSAWSLVLCVAVLSIWIGIRADLDQADQLAVVLLPIAVGVVVIVSASLPMHTAISMTSVIIGVGLAVALSAWIGVAFHYLPWALHDGHVWRGSSTLTYPSAAGLVIVLALLVLLGSQWATKPKVTVACMLCIGLVSTGSRGALFAALAALVVYGALRGVGAVLPLLIAASSGAAVALIGLLPSMTGGSAQPWLALGGLTLALAVALLAYSYACARLAAIFGSAVACLYVAQLSPDALLGGPAARLSLASPDRLMEWKAAGRVISTNLLFGTGLSHDRITWNDAGATMSARYAHNEYLQTMMDLGLVGALMLGLCGLLAWRFLYSRSASSQRSAVGCAAIVAGCAAGLFDFIWHVPAVALLIGLIVGVELSKRSTNAAAARLDLDVAYGRAPLKPQGAIFGSVHRFRLGAH